ncbi:MAG: selenide, water dikinase SelD [Planctomycetes bacterium]|nr:selenide, water dikinase SelD [Planctomycetota bacterium]
MPIGQLAQVLRGVSGEKDGRLLVGPETFDDAGVVELAGVEGLPAGTDLALVQTVDYFPPVVDDPWFYGAIAAANSVSDVYAMGGRPYTALNLAGIPKDFAPEWTSEIFRGGFETMRKAGALVVGGHTVQSAEAMFGFAVTGFVDRRKVTTNAGARPGDVLYLTKKLGMGALTTAAKAQKISWKELEPAAVQMAALNDTAALAMNAVGARACTDITGFGLVGHARNIAKGSRLTLRIELARTPIFDGALALARAGTLSGGARRGRAALGDVVAIRAGLEEALVNLVFDAETSGGLMIAVSPAKAAALEKELAARDLIVARIGECVPDTGKLVELI